MSKVRNYDTPVEVCMATIDTGVTKANLPFLKMFLLAILAGAFIAFGAEASNVAMHNIANVGVARVVAGAVFPIGLIMIVTVAGELFTGNCLMVEALFERKIGLGKLLRNWGVVWVGNLVGALLIVFLVAATGQLDYTNGMLGALTIKIALGKEKLSFLAAFTSAILCNILVCVAVLIGTAAKDIIGKCVGIFIPIFAFVLSGFEHCVANMYYLPAGQLAAQNPLYAARAQELYGITPDQLASLNVGGFFHNLIPSTLGNIVGGALVGIAIWAIFKSRACNKLEADQVATELPTAVEE